MCRPLCFSLSVKVTRWCIAACFAALLLETGDAHATDPEAICAERETIVAMLDGKPHFERQAFVLQDEFPGQGHRFELYVNSGEGGRHSYSLLRIRSGGNIACILTAGLVSRKAEDSQGQTHITLNDETDPDIFEVVLCEKGYVITRGVVERNVCDAPEKLIEDGKFITSYGHILEDHRKDISWPGQ